MEIEHFAPHEGSKFRIQNGSDNGYELDLIEVKSLKNEDDIRDPSFRQEPFRLTFRSSSKEEYFPQNIYQLAHATMGEIEIFLVPIGPDSEGMRYESIFN
jgi:hypothetical protein